MKVFNITNISNIKLGSINNNGFGPTTVLRSTTSYVGDKKIDYYGTIPSNEFFTAPELMSLCGLTSVDGSSSSVSKWFKVDFDGKILYFPLENVTDGISFHSLYVKGLVYGEDGFGKFPSGSGVPQNTTISKNGYTYKVRLFNVFNTDPHNGSTGTNIANMRGSEWAELVYRIASSNPYGTSDNFETNSFPCNGVLAKEAFNTQGTIKTCVGQGTSVGIISNQSGNATHKTFRYWKPLLELVK